ncbi:Got1/Sft2-like family-domain-containing protein [Glomus cerebriforme]|uniref:Protein transport protein SFT2 n=1 Tax=Glomus cerebriforme TaxID=658196 RepID=A0A397S6E5_9GLOM|nr:Got1/Sft2-like family-domain-containing protein [Glomus cerebriforme]
MSSSEQQFRESLRSFRWSSNSNNDVNPNKTSTFSQLTENTSIFFGNVSNRVRGYVPLSNNNVVEDDDWFTLTRWQRLIGFGVCMLAGVLCFLISFLTLPLLVLKLRKFVVTYTMGSVLILTSFALLHGPLAHIKHILSRERLPFTVAYLGSMIATLYFAIGLRNTLLTLLFSIIQVIALIWYTVSYLPGGIGSLQVGSRMIARQVLPI